MLACNAPTALIQICLIIYLFTHVKAVHVPLFGPSHLNVHVGTGAVAPPKNGKQLAWQTNPKIGVAVITCIL